MSTSPSKAETVSSMGKIWRRISWSRNKQDLKIDAPKANKLPAKAPGDSVTPPISPRTVVDTAIADTTPVNTITPPESPIDISPLDGDERNGYASTMEAGVKIVGSSESNINSNITINDGTDTDTSTPHSPTSTSSTAITVIYSPLSRHGEVESSQRGTATHCSQMDIEQTDTTQSPTSAPYSATTHEPETFRRRVEPYIRQIVEGRENQEITRCLSEVLELECLEDENIEDLNLESEKLRAQEKWNRENRNGSGSEGGIGRRMSGRTMSFWKGKGKERNVDERSEEERREEVDTVVNIERVGGDESENSPTASTTSNGGFFWQPRRMLSGKGKGKGKDRSKSDGQLINNIEVDKNREKKETCEKRRNTWAALSRIPTFRKAPVVETPPVIEGEEVPVVESAAQRLERERLEREQERERRNMSRRTNWPDADLDDHKDEFADQGEYFSDFMNEVILADRKAKANAKGHAS